MERTSLTPWQCTLLLALSACEGLVGGMAGPLDGIVALDGGQAVGFEERHEGTLVLSFEHRFGIEPLVLQTTYSTRYGQDVSFDQLRYWVSKVSLARGDEAPYEVPASYYLVERTAERERVEVDVDGIPAGAYDRITFHLGVDPGPNGDLDMLAGELARGIGMDWGADTGFVFFRAEGAFSERGVKGRFDMQTGQDVLYKRLTATLSVPLVIVDGGSTRVTLQADMSGIFAALELSESADIRGGAVDSLAGKVAGNYARMFSLVTGAERVPLTASSPDLGMNVGGEVPDDSTPPFLTEAIVNLSEGLLCAEVASRPPSAVRACFGPFMLGAGDDYRDAGFFSLVTPNDAPVVAASPGTIAEVRVLEHSLLTHSDLFMVVVRSSDDSPFWIEYRNLKNLTVEEGDAVAAGQVLGGAGDYFDASVGVVSLAVRREQELVQRLCPKRYMPADLVSDYEAALAASNAAWPAISHDDLCQTPSIVCKGNGQCAGPADFEAAAGDVDEGRRIYASSCASCHGASGEGNIGPQLCSGPGCPCVDCVDHVTLATRTEQDMPPEGRCNAQCAADVAAFVLHEFRTW